jgi:hypothetical protein
MDGKPKQLAAYNEFERIQKAIEKITEIGQIVPTYNWVKLFDKRFGYAELTGYLTTRLNEKEL